MAHGQVDRSKMPEPGPAPEVNLKEPKRFSLKNGLEVLVVENNKLPRVSIQLTLDNAPILEGDKAGVASLTGNLMGNGTTNIPKDEFNEEVDYLGARLSFGSQSAFASTLSRYFPRILELMADAAINPNFLQEEFEKEKQKLITSLKSSENDVKAVANRVKGALAYGKNHPYGEFATIETVNNIQLEDVSRFYRAHFVPANAYLVIVGDVAFEKVKALVEEYFTPWTKAAPPSFSYSKPTGLQYTQVNFVDMPNAVQSEISVQNLVDLKMKDKDYLAALLANRILGGGAQGRLFLNLREDKAYTYGSYSSIGSDKYAPTLFRASASVRNMVTDSAAVEILSEVNKIITEQVSEEELEIAKAEYMGSFVMNLERPETIARYALNIITEDLPSNYYTTYLERLEAVTLEEVQAAAKKYLTADKARVVIVGKGSDVLPNLKQMTFKGERVPIRYFDKYANKTEAPQYDMALPEGVDAKSVLMGYLEAIGGADKIKAMSGVKITYAGEVMGANLEVTEVRTPEKYAQQTNMNGNRMMRVVITPEKQFMEQGGNQMPMPEGMYGDMQGVMGLFAELGALENPGTRLKGVEQVEGKKAYAVEIPGELVNIVMYYDTQSGLKLKEMNTITMNGQSQTQQVLFKDYQPTGGILFPTKRVAEFGPQQVEMKMTGAEVNPDLQSVFN